MFWQRKIQENTKYPETEGLWLEKDQNRQRKIQRSTNHQTKENVLNPIKDIENNLKISRNTERNLRFQEKHKILLQSRKKSTQRPELELDLSRIKRGTCKQLSNQKMSELLNEQRWLSGPNDGY